jgi:membrane-bound lytic murein transglycosylase A
MTPACVRAAAATVLAAALAAGCTSTNQPAPTLRLARASFAALPKWQSVHLDAALAAFQRGCAMLARRDAHDPMGGAGYAGTIGDWRAPCEARDADARQFFETRFTPFTVQAAGHGLFTGYYEPQIKVSRSREGAFQIPIYGLPPDLVRADLGAFLSRLKGEHIAGKLQGRTLIPYADRAAIDAAGIPGAVPILYTDDSAALFFLQIQGSGRGLLADGEVVRLAYAGDNGQPYTAIGRVLVDEKELSKDAVSLQTIRAWLKAHPQKARAVMEQDKSYVFFRETPLGDPALGGIGTLGVKLTPEASLAVDARLHALAMPFYVATEGDDAFDGLLIAQDTGGAIRGAVRGDIFFGFGAEAEQRAGMLKAPGLMFVLLPNALAAKLGDSWTAP